MYKFSICMKLRINTKFNVVNKIHKVNVTKEPLDKLSSKFLLKMDKFFDGDIRLLSKLIKKDLSKWRFS